MGKNMYKTDKDKFSNPNVINQSSGFTLIELAVVLLITSILTIPLLQLYSNYITEQRVKITKENVINAARAMSLSNVTRYPCPSDRSLPPNAFNYGRDVCTLSGFTLASIPNCNTTGQEQGVCKTLANATKYVLIGGVPIKSGDQLNPVTQIYGTVIKDIDASKTLDAWGNQLTYAVSYDAASPYRTEGFTRYKGGVIRVVDEWGNDTAGTNSDALFMIVSHGLDGTGAYTKWQAKNPCAMGNDDSENCDGDATLVQGISHFGGTKKYDDYSFVQTENSSNLWQIVTDPLTTAPTTHISTIPVGNLGVNMATQPGDVTPLSPNAVNYSNIKVRLDVNGSLSADSIRSQAICNRDGTGCLGIDRQNGFFGSQKSSNVAVNLGQPSGTLTVRNDCADGQVISYISDSKVQCSYAAITFQPTFTLCPLGQWVTQIDTDGKFICSGGAQCPGASCITCPGGTGCP